MLMLEHLNALYRMQQFDFSHELTRDYTLEQLNHSCDMLEKLDFHHEPLLPHTHIQRALIEQPGFLERYQELALRGISNRQIDEWLHLETETGCRLMEQALPQLVEAFAVKFPDAVMAQEYLTFYLSRNLAPDVLDAVRSNIPSYHWGSSQSLFNLDGAQRELLQHPFFACFTESLDKLAAMKNLLSNPALVSFLDALYADNRRYPFIAVHLESLAQLEQEPLFTLRNIMDLLEPIDGLMEQFVDIWQENGAYGAELKDFYQRALQLSLDDLNTALENRLSYLNLLYGNVLKGIPFDRILHPAQNLLIHALANRQKSFLRMVVQHFDSFSCLPEYSVLLNPSFYKRLCLNALSPKDLAACQTAILNREGRAALAILEQRTYTFSELCLLSQSPTVYARFYNQLALDRVDDRMITLRQLLKHELLSDLLSDHALEQLAACLSQKSLSRWRDEDFWHISGVTLNQCVGLLEKCCETRRFWPALSNSSEAAFLIRQGEKLAAYSAWSDVVMNLEEIDDAWRQLKQDLELDAAFAEKHRDCILEFLMEDGAAIALTYARSLAEPEGYYRIVRALLMGEYHTLKYYRDDLDREISYGITDAQKARWCDHLRMEKDRFVVAERDDFFTTMRIGTIPERTCLSYIEGAQRNCLLACFDSNKKILYATLNGKPVARAVIRLTKGCRQVIKESAPALEFADLRKAPSSEQGNPKAVDELVLFLERPYTSYLNEQDIFRIERMFAEMAIRKAALLSAKPVLSQNYIGVYRELNMVSMAYNIYISRSKAGEQYLDSLGGANSVSSEGSYKAGSFLMLPD